MWNEYEELSGQRYEKKKGIPVYQLKECEKAGVH